jgi:hypothetical protein
MEPHKEAKYSKSLDPDKIEEVLMNEDSDEELEERDEVMEPHVQSFSSSEDDDDTEEINTCHPKLQEALQFNHLIIPSKKCTRFLDL